jgi:hypothetical protein
LALLVGFAIDSINDTKTDSCAIIAPLFFSVN